MPHCLCSQMISNESLISVCRDDLLLMSTPPQPVKDTATNSGSVEPSSAASSLDKLLNCTPSDASSSVCSAENVCKKFLLCSYILVLLAAVPVDSK